MRVGPDGFVLRETVSEYIQMLEVSAGELGGETLRIAKPEGMPDEIFITMAKKTPHQFSNDAEPPENSLAL